jgi:hypothetical protein
MVKVYKGILGPYTLSQLLPGQQLAWPFKQRHQDLDRLLLTTNAHSILPEFSGTGINFVGAKSKNGSEGI